jgi:hypothetical protein
MVFRDIALFAQRLLAILPADYWWLLRCLFYAGYVSGVCHYPYSYTGSGDSTPLPDLQKRISTPQSSHQLYWMEKAGKGLSS